MSRTPGGPWTRCGRPPEKEPGYLLRRAEAFVHIGPAMHPRRPEPQCGTRRLVKAASVLYRAAMGPVGRHVLAFFLAIALIAGGVPVVHAMPSTVPVVAVVVDAHSHDAGYSTHHHIHTGAAAETQIDNVSSDKIASDLCKGLKCCSMCAASYVAPLSRNLSVDRIFFAIRYGVPVIAHLRDMTFIDPGIPIA